MPRLPAGAAGALICINAFRMCAVIVHKHPVPEAFARDARVKAADYAAMYRDSVRDPAGFWARIAKRIDWFRFPTRIRDVSFDPADFRVRWFEDGELNVSVNCLDRQLAKRGDKTALLFEGDRSEERRVGKECRL